MKLLYTLVSFFLLAFTFANIADVSLHELAARGEALGDLAQLIPIAKRGPSATVQEEEATLVKRGSTPPEYSALTVACNVLNNTGFGVQTEYTLCTQSATSGTVITTINQYLTKENLTTILEALDDSNLALDVVMAIFTDSSFGSGLWTVVKTLWSNGVIHLKRDEIELTAINIKRDQEEIALIEEAKRQNISVEELKKRGLLDFLGGIFNVAEITAIDTFITAIQATTNLGSICVSLEKSGLGLSLIEELFGPSNMQSFAVQLVTTIIQDKTITLSYLLSSLEQSGIVTSTIKKILANSTDVKIIFLWAVKLLVSLIKYVI
ncbi:hypothetical protein DFJ63DRAFT_22273 [Scheffersomyces coipomensis]|uniref:uncharacterized protein n=1 Tax=Scheffersomyces coipomensis TaxID=1788519 RepID=UPI00315DE47F